MWVTFSMAIWTKYFKVGWVIRAALPQLENVMAVTGKEFNLFTAISTLP